MLGITLPSSRPPSWALRSSSSQKCSAPSPPPSCSACRRASTSSPRDLRIHLLLSPGVCQGRRNGVRALRVMFVMFSFYRGSLRAACIRPSRGRLPSQGDGHAALALDAAGRVLALCLSRGDPAHGRAPPHLVPALFDRDDSESVFTLANYRTALQLGPSAPRS